MVSLLRSFIFFLVILQVTSGQGTNGEVPKLPQLRDEKTTIGDGEGPERVPEPQPEKLSSYRGLRSLNCIQFSSTYSRDQTRPSSIGHRRRSNRNEVRPSMSFSRRSSSGGSGGGGGGGKSGGGGSKGGGGSSKGGGSSGKKSGGKTSTGTGTTSAQSGHQSSGDHNKAHICNFLFPIFMTSFLMLGIPYWS